MWFFHTCSSQLAWRASSVASPIGMPPLTRSASGTEEGWWAQRVAWYPTGCFGPYRSPEVGYSRRELAADAAVHLVGVVLGFVCGAALLLKVNVRECPSTVAFAVGIYVASLLCMLCCSAAFNMLVARMPHHLWALQLADHTGILLLICGTYTPFLTVLCFWSTLAFVWTVGLVSFVAKASRSALDVLPLHVCCFLAMGWAALAVWPDLRSAAPPRALALAVLGGTIYSVGLVPWAVNRLEFHNAIWHVFVLVASGVFYVMIDGEVATPSAFWSAGCPQ